MDTYRKLLLTEESGPECIEKCTKYSDERFPEQKMFTTLPEVHFLRWRLHNAHKLGTWPTDYIDICMDPQDPHRFQRLCMDLNTCVYVPAPEYTSDAGDYTNSSKGDGVNRCISCAQRGPFFTLAKQFLIASAKSHSIIFRLHYFDKNESSMAQHNYFGFTTPVTQYA